MLNMILDSHRILGIDPNKQLSELSFSMTMA